MNKIQVFAADDNIEFCESIQELIHSQPNMEIVGAAYNGEEAYDKICALQPDVILLDNCMPYMDGLDVVKKFRKIESNFKSCL